MAPVTVGIRRVVEKNRENDRPAVFYEYGAFQTRRVTVDVWGSNFGGDVSATLHISAVDLNTPWKVDFPSRKVQLSENRSTELWRGECPSPKVEEAFDKHAPSGSVVIHAKLVGEDGKLLSCISNWPEPYRQLELSDPGLKVVVDTGGEVRVWSEKPVKGLWLSVEGEDDGLEWGDNGVS